ncbi:MAG: hypothetical protein US96_C0022G0003 [Candidatus Woesebacteria bacterium GW2011_GWB1_38_5b]|uniref:Uncharacterized protein n=1 Tax=Candidatus Woesebacteria bacterium GW2011_GWB1_38_5b TaxID=1618569 RepID=A0A0G0K7S8_9BACT|nr:MAG: hypothetical protein US96_C0022G0003 [Candidatus Woesebacteria bacterium GW2011_GWB1_38_5b]
MGRPHCNYKIGFCPGFSTFKPEGIDCDEFVEVTPEEIESLRLKNIKSLDQTEAAQKMKLPFNGLLLQHVPIFGSSKISEYNNLLPAFLSRATLNEFAKG